MFQFSIQNFSLKFLFSTIITFSVLSFSLAHGQNLLMFDMLGNLVFRTSANSNEQSFSLAHLNSGTYFVEIIDENGEKLDKSRLVKN